MFPNLGPMEMMVVMIVAVLLFGKRLPEVGRSLGKGIIEFKKGLRGIEDELTSATKEPEPSRRHVGTTSNSAAEAEPAVPKFEPPSSAPVAREEFEPQAYQDY